MWKPHIQLPDSDALEIGFQELSVKRLTAFMLRSFDVGLRPYQVY